MCQRKRMAWLHEWTDELRASRRRPETPPVPAPRDRIDRETNVPESVAVLAKLRRDNTMRRTALLDGNDELTILCNLNAIQEAEEQRELDDLRQKQLEDRASAACIQNTLRLMQEQEDRTMAAICIQRWYRNMLLSRVKPVQPPHVTTKKRSRPFH